MLFIAADQTHRGPQGNRYTAKSGQSVKKILAYILQPAWRPFAAYKTKPLFEEIKMPQESKQFYEEKK